MADRKRSGSLSRGVEQDSPPGTPQLHGEGRPSPSPTRRMLTRAGRTGPASDAGRTCIRSVRRGPRAGLPARRFGACRPVFPCLTPCQAGRLACTHSRPIRPRSGVERRPRSERRQPPAGRTPPPAGPGTAVRPLSRGREGRRPRDGRRTPALATAHPAGLNCGPARRVRLSQIPASRTAKRRSVAAAERPGHRISAFHLDGAGKKRGFAAGRHFLATTTAVPDEGTALSGRPA